MQGLYGELVQEHESQQVKEPGHQSAHPILGDAVDAGAVLDAGLRDAEPSPLGHDGDEAMEVPVERNVLDHDAAIGLEAAVEVVEANAGNH